MALGKHYSQRYAGKSSTGADIQYGRSRDEFTTPKFGYGKRMQDVTHIQVIDITPRNYIDFAFQSRYNESKACI